MGPYKHETNRRPLPLGQPFRSQTGVGCMWDGPLSTLKKRTTTPLLRRSQLAWVNSLPVKRHRGEPGHTQDTHGTRRRTRAQGHTDHTDEPHNHPNPRPTHNPHVSATAETAADSTAAGPEPTAPRGRLRRGRPQRTRPCLHPLHYRYCLLCEVVTTYSYTYNRSMCESESEVC